MQFLEVVFAVSLFSISTVVSANRKDFGTVKLLWEEALEQLLGPKILQEIEEEAQKLHSAKQTFSADPPSPWANVGSSFLRSTLPPTEPPPPATEFTVPPTEPPILPPTQPPIPPTTKPPVPWRNELRKPWLKEPPILPPTEPPILPPTEPPILPPTEPPVPWRKELRKPWLKEPPILPPTEPPIPPPTEPQILPPTEPPVPWRNELRKPWLKEPPILPTTEPPILPPTEPPILPPTESPVPWRKELRKPWLKESQESWLTKIAPFLPPNTELQTEFPSHPPTTPPPTEPPLPSTTEYVQLSTTTKPPTTISTLNKNQPWKRPQLKQRPPFRRQPWRERLSKIPMKKTISKPKPNIPNQVRPARRQQNLQPTVPSLTNTEQPDRRQNSPKRKKISRKPWNHVKKRPKYRYHYGFKVFNTLSAASEYVDGLHKRNHKYIHVRDHETLNKKSRNSRKRPQKVYRY